MNGVWFLMLLTVVSAMVGFAAICARACWRAHLRIRREEAAWLSEDQRRWRA